MSEVLTNADVRDSNRTTSTLLHKFLSAARSQPILSEDHTNGPASDFLYDEGDEIALGELLASPRDEEECRAYSASMQTPIGVFCNATWDSFYCWPPTRAGEIVSRSCEDIFTIHDMNMIKQYPAGASAFRICDSTGEWLWGNWTNYTECLDLIPMEDHQAPVAVVYILFICNVISLLFLAITLFIFFYFKSLLCSRLRVHRNLAIALIIHSAIMAIISSPSVMGDAVPSYQQIEWLCRAVLSVKMYAALCSINWMFLEGVLLHSRITISIFRKDAPFKVYYCIGWGLPGILIVIWALTLSHKLDTPCWEGYGGSPYVWIITGPMITALIINSIFLINIIRILVTKLRASSSIETTQIRKAIKATALLFPLLGIPHLLFCINPQDDSRLEEIYLITNAVLQSSQGIFVAILYCFMNTEVHQVLRNAYLRAAIRRNPNRYSTRGRFLSQSSATYLSRCDSTAGPPGEVVRLKTSPQQRTRTGSAAITASQLNMDGYDSHRKSLLKKDSKSRSPPKTSREDKHTNGSLG